jgi:hypothetical protein
MAGYIVDSTLPSKYFTVRLYMFAVTYRVMQEERTIFWEL